MPQDFTITSASGGAGADASSDLATAQAAYLANADYQENGGDAIKCRAFMTACRRLILLLPRLAGTRESHLQMSPELLQGEIDTAQRWLEGPGASATGSATGNSAAGGPRMTKASFANFRC